MCAMKEVTLFMDDAKSKESAKHLGQVNTFVLLEHYPLLYLLLLFNFQASFFVLSSFGRKYLFWVNCNIRILCSITEVRWYYLLS